MHKKNILLGNFNAVNLYANKKTKKFKKYIPDAWLPYSSGCLIWHARKNPEINEKYNFYNPLFIPKGLDEYHDLLLETDILGLTCYTWNQQYTDQVGDYYKKIRPDGILVYGGPQVPENAEMYTKFCEERPYLDVAIAGLAEYAFEEWLLDKPFSGQKIKELPTPYTDGIFDYIFKNPDEYSGYVLRCPVETDRGCPYKCAFCDWGGNSHTKITKFELQKSINELEFMYKNKVESLFIANANFGVFRDDITILESLVEFQKKYSHKIKIIYGGLAKNGNKNLPRILDLLEDELSGEQVDFKVSFQTHTPEVLKIIDRDNIKNELLLPIIGEQRAKGKQVTAEMIITLPGETGDSWLRTLAHNYHELNIHKTMTHIALVVVNTSLGDPEYQKKYKIKTKKVFFNKIQYYEIMYESISYDLEELVKMFDYQWYWHNFINTSIAVGRIHNLFDQTKFFFDNLDNFPILSSCVEKQRDVVRRVFAPEPETVLTDELEVLWFAKSGRLGELALMKEHYQQTDQELKVLFGNDLEVDWTKFEVPFKWTY